MAEPLRQMEHFRNHSLSGGQAAIEFTGEVTDFREVGKVAGERLFHVALDHSAFTPQHSAGVLIASSRTGLTLEAEVVAVEEGVDGQLWHTTRKPLQPGVPVRGRVYMQSPAT